MTKNTLLVIAALVLIALLVFLSIQLFWPATPQETPAPATPTPAPVTEAPTPAPTAEPTPTPEPTPEPTPTPTPEPTPTPTPEPTPTPTPAPPATQSGSFSSDTGTPLNVRADWKTYTDASGAQKLQVDVVALHYSCFTSSLWNGVELTVDGQTYSANSPAISYDGNAQQTTTLYSWIIDAPDSASVSIRAVWHYRGTYSGKALDDIVASGTATIR